MAVYTTVAELRIRLDEVPAGAEVDAKLDEFLDSAETMVLRQLIGVTITPPAPVDMCEVIYQVASSLYLTRGTASRLATVGADGSGGYEFAGSLTVEQKATLRQLRIEMAAVAL